HAGGEPAAASSGERLADRRPARRRAQRRRAPAAHGEMACGETGRNDVNSLHAEVRIRMAQASKTTLKESDPSGIWMTDSAATPTANLNCRRFRRDAKGGCHGEKRLDATRFH